MRDIINATVCENHFLKCATYSIARNGEGFTPCLSITIPVGLYNYWAYIDFKKPNGETFKTPRIDVSEGKINYNIPSAVLDADGTLEVQVVFQNADGDIWKTYVKEFAVRYSINATDDIPDKQDFITEAQKLLDAISSTVDGGSVVEFVVVNELPTENIKNAIYLVPNEDEKDRNLFDEFIFINGAWEMIGSAGVEVDLAEYVKKTQYATQDTAGVVRVYGTGNPRNTTGIGISGNGVLAVKAASKELIDSKGVSAYGVVGDVIKPSNLDYAVKVGLTTNTETLTDGEKAAAQSWLGISNTGSGSSSYPKKVFEYEWKDNYDQIDVTSIDYATGILTVSAMPTQITDDVNTTVRVFPATKIEGITIPFKYGMMPKEIMETASGYYAKKVGENQIILCPNTSTEITSITNSEVVDLTRWNLFVERKRNQSIPFVEVDNLDTTHRYKAVFYMPHSAHYCSGISFIKNDGFNYGEKYPRGYRAVTTSINPNSPTQWNGFSLNLYETISLRDKHYGYSDNIVVKFPRYFEVDIYRLSNEAYNADVNLFYFAPFATPNDNTVFATATAKQNIFLQQPFSKLNFNSGNGNYMLDGARCEVWDYGEVL